MRIHSTLLLLAALAFSGCAKSITISEIKPQRAGFPTKIADPLSALSRYIEAAESAWRKLDGNPADLKARRDYNFAVARLCGTLREAKLAPWNAPIRAGTHTLAWKRDPRPERNPRLFEFIPTDQLEIRGTDVDQRTTKDGLGAPLVAKRIADQAHELAPTPHFYFATTAIARFEGSPAGNQPAPSRPRQSFSRRLSSSIHPTLASITPDHGSKGGVGTVAALAGFVFTTRQTEEGQVVFGVDVQRRFGAREGT